MTKYNAFRKHAIPFEMSPTSDFSQKLSVFKEIDSKLQQLKIPERQNLVKKLRKKWLSLPENEEMKRELGLEEGYAFTASFDNLPLSEIAKLNGIFRGIFFPTALRNTATYIRNAKNEVVREFPPHQALPELLNELKVWDYENKDQLSAFILHFLILSIHPFDDGNGRLARAYEWSRLRQIGFKFQSGWGPEVIIHWQASRYNEVLESCRESGFVDDFISFMLDGYIGTGEALILSSI